MFSSSRILALSFCLILFSGCQTQEENAANIQTEETTPTPKIEQGLVLYNSVLEQSNADGETLWRLSTEKVIYTQDKKIAKLENLTGNLFENGEIILKVKADYGEIRNDGKEIYLNDNILAVDPRNQAELQGNYVEWKPEKNYFLIQDNLRGNHAKLTVTAKQAIYNTKIQNLELKGEILANTKNPQLNLQTEYLYWQISDNKIIGNSPLFISRYQDKMITDKLTTENAEIDLDKNIAIIQGNIEYQSLEPPLQGATKRIIWQYEKRKMEANEPIRLFKPDEDMTLTANLAKLNLEKKEVYLEGGVYGEAVENEAKIYADNLLWNLDSEEITANDNVYYQQINPDFNLRGAKAEGNLPQKNITVTGNYKDKVITIIYPED